MWWSGVVALAGDWNFEGDDGLFAWDLAAVFALATAAAQRPELLADQSKHSITVPTGTSTSSCSTSARESEAPLSAATTEAPRSFRRQSATLNRHVRTNLLIRYHRRVLQLCYLCNTGEDHR